MSAPTSPAASRPRRARKSIAHFSTQEDALLDKSQESKAAKKSRSKSLGPGGLEALKEGNGNKQKPLPAIRSILKPTIALSPPKPIPPHTPKTKSPRSDAKSASPTRRSTRRNTQSPLSPGLGLSPAKISRDETAAAVVALRTEEEQQRAARERDRQEAIKRRDERRKSLANRRVSFAPEATLHTWDVVEINEDATTSSEATNSTRRQSNLNNTMNSTFAHGTQHAPDPELDANVPSTPTHHEELSSPERQRDLHQKKRRRSSTIPQGTFEDDDPLTSSPTSSLGDDNTEQTFASGSGDEDEDDEDNISETDTYRDDESTAMDIDEPELDDEDNTGRTTGSIRTDDTSSSSSSAQLNARLKRAIEQATTQNFDFDGIEQSNEEFNDAMSDHIRGQESGAPQDVEEDGMDMTDAIGGILPEILSSPFETSPVKASPKRRSSRVSRRRSSGVASNADDETMDLTTAIGGIRRSSIASRRESGATVATEDEDMSMELTNVVGGVISRMTSFNTHEDEAHDFEPDLTAQMDMTTVYGRILSPVTERTEPSTETSESMDLTTAVGVIEDPIVEASAVGDETATMNMDVTEAIGNILPTELQTNDRNIGKLLMEEEAEHGQLTKSPLAKEPTYPALPNVSEVTNSEALQQLPTTTPSHSPEARIATPRSANRSTPLNRNTHTPTHQLTPQPAPRPTTPSKTPPNKNIGMRRTSPKKLFSQSTRERQVTSASPAKSPAGESKRRATVHADSQASTTPKANPMLGGANRKGLGSPLVSELLDRRASISEAAKTFTPQGPASQSVRFADPRELEEQVDQERAREFHRESGRDALERDIDIQHQDKDNTLSLRDMIQSLTPKKKDLKGRKSLAVGSGWGLLGKRPVELDDGDEDDTPKRLKGPDRSPVKSIRLPAPPSKEETTGRMGKLGRMSLGPLSANIGGTPSLSSASPSKTSTPKDQTRFREFPMDGKVAPPVTFRQRDAGISPDPESAQDDENEQIQLQEFLNLINVRFMDLETTKRRHTIAPRSRSSFDDGANERKFEDCVVAGVSTIPMMELYQHSCRELKKYISEGRSIVREIEQDTYEDNPALFKEYMSAAPDMRAIMDNQFKNVKTHSRLLSRAMWYEWRMKLLEGLKDGLVKIGDNLSGDDKSLSKQEALIGDVVTKLVSEHERLQEREQELQRHAEELASCDQDELREVREELHAADQEYEEKQKILAELRLQKERQDAEHARLTERKQRCTSEIVESRKLSDEYRGWKSSEVAALKGEVEALERHSGWTVLSASDGGSLTLGYRRTLRLYLRPSSFLPAASSPPCTMHLSLQEDDNIAAAANEPSTQQRFFLQLLRARLHALDQASTPLRRVLGLVATGWRLAGGLQDAISDLTQGHMTDVAITGDESIAVTASILLRPMRTRVLARFKVVVGSGRPNTDNDDEEEFFSVSTRTAVSVVYGEELMEGKMADFLAQRISAGSGAGTGASDGAGFARWAGAVRELEAKLAAQGRRERKQQPASSSVVSADAPAAAPTSIPRAPEIRAAAAAAATTAANGLAATESGAAV